MSTGNSGTPSSNSRWSHESPPAPRSGNRGPGGSGSGSGGPNSNSRHGSGGSGGGGGAGRRGGGGDRGGGGGQGQGQHMNANRQRGGDRRDYNRDRSHLPLEQGAIRTLKESFGFIQCADRPDDIFFHYSELVLNGDITSPTDLKVDDPVEFRVGTSSSGGNSGSGGGSSEKKLAAYQVRRLSEPIVWEIAFAINTGSASDGGSSRVRGLVDRVTNKSTGEGWIRVLVESSEQPATKATTKDEQEEEEDANKDVVEKPEGPLVKFLLRDYTPSSTSSSNSNNQNANNQSSSNKRLSRGDLVELDVFVQRRTKDKIAKNIVLLMSEQQRLAEERERRLMETAVEEHGVVTALKGDYGFLRSNKRREEVYFHYSSVHVGEEEDSLVLKEGQEMKFLVVNHDHQEDHSPSGGGGGTTSTSTTTGYSGGATTTTGGISYAAVANAKPKRVSARRVQLQPRGSVRFHDAVACGVTGRVTICPQPIDAGHSLEARGKIRLSNPIVLPPKNEGGAPRTISEVYLASADSPGGTYAFRGGTAVATWVQVGDSLLFDVVKDYVDGACHAAPTVHLVPNPTPMEPEQEHVDDVRKVRLIELSLVGRAEGVINAVKETYGFLHFSERAVDVHFKLYQLLPDELQEDIRRNRGIASVDDKGMPLRLSLETETEFDISVHGHIHQTAHHHHSSKHGNKNKNNNNNLAANNSSLTAAIVHERENLKAQRVLLLPPKSIQLSKVLASKVRGRIAKEDSKQPYAGMLDLDEPVKPITLEERHPLVSRMIDEYLADDEWQVPLVYHDVLSAKEDDTVFEMMEHKGVVAGGGEGVANNKWGTTKLTWTHLPVVGENFYPGRLCIRKVVEQPIVAAVSATASATPTAAPTEAPAPESAAAADHEHADSSSGEGGDDSKTHSGHTSTNGDESSSSLDDKPKHHQNQQQRHHNKSPKKRTGPKLIRAARYDKSSLSAELKEPGIAAPACDDIVEFDIVQSRRTMQVSVENLVMIERKNPDMHYCAVAAAADVAAAAAAAAAASMDESRATAESGGGGIGVVSEVVVARNFGFITVLDESATKRETLFFSLVGGGGGDSKSSNKKNKSKLQFRKGDEVKFDVKTENGKRVAFNVALLPKGTVPSKADKNACRGLVLLAPSNSRLKTLSSAGGGGGSSTPRHNTPPRHSSSAASSEGGGGSRWDNIGKEEVNKRSFSKDTSTTTMEEGCILLLDDPSNMFAIATEGGDTKQAAAITTVDTTGGGGGSEKGNEESIPTVRRVAYTTGGLAIYGQGASTASDDSANPRRGDLVTFVRSNRDAANCGAWDVRILTRGAANLVRGRLEDVADGKAKFITSGSGGGEEVYEIDLSEFVSGDASLIKEKEAVEGVLYEGKIFGVCRTVDLNFESKVRMATGQNSKERTKLNLTVKKDRGGTIIAQSMMAKGPDGTNGFSPGWTKRVSKYAPVKDEEKGEDSESKEEYVDNPLSDDGEPALKEEVAS